MSKQATFSVTDEKGKIFCSKTGEEIPRKKERKFEDMLPVKLPLSLVTITITT